MLVLNSPVMPSLQAENDSLRQSLQALSVKSAALQADIDIMIPLQASMQAENDALREKVRTLCDQNDLFLQQQSSLEAGNIQLQDQIKKLNSEVTLIWESDNVEHQIS
jgi:predicted nuclease with TOPRIM domain